MLKIDSKPILISKVNWYELRLNFFNILFELKRSVSKKELHFRRGSVDV